ncbi:multicopper oxidase family protein [Actinocatenispora rupis]|uniref:Spore coat protein A n=1 Tax=Actinocatenispora rupis TaxID=519421 RepID=A0A8J3NBZ2_9ACTN|nr:multicopper oxidase family protein [Actinocatenispora rupis]GID09839.1 spore coat protein A [Actinocatenispora rupis]
MSLSRRRLFRVAAGGLLVPAVAGCGGLSMGGGNTETESSAGALLVSGARLPAPFRVPLPVPPVLRPLRTAGGVDSYEVTQRAARVEILPGTRTTIWGYEGVFPGPTIVSRRGRRTVVRHHNALPVPTVVHLHGGRTPAEHDGYPTDTVAPGGSREYRYPVEQRAATLWYHDHRLDFTGPQVWRGLAGFHLVHDDEEDALPLPRGDRDVPLMVADRSFGADGALAYPALDPSLTGMPGVRAEFMSGVLGDCILVNGAPWPTMEVSAVRYRFRLLNASNARRYELALDPPPPDGRAFVQVGGDQGLLPAPIGHDTLRIAQAERFDVVVDFSRYSVGQRVTLVNRLGSGGTARVMRFVVARRGHDDSHVPERLAEYRPLGVSEAVRRREFTFRRGGPEHHGVTPWTVDGHLFDPDRMAAEPELGTVELWRLHAQNVPHPVHVHLAPFQVRNADRYSRGWKDTVDLSSGDAVEVLLRFDGYRGRYVFHCHNLEHEDMMMMANFRVR